ncbi:MAG: thymidine phosphorylase [Candidatus Marinimicrobia bacterium]|jgi:pyrimidine-nucleoside phosphorylase|nr:thymidine phosphorylase [Candidatus Neomarinimicrobiota bacterium]MBT3633879.1 thymidine phosphorylase [Candidatus Neomarinimicrobiota bacterium]MBT3682871.1 thymidine phosphorylase [Candidatus Neomarinimicrobiota bacterium]MBT3759942.1 thymidine phosphorylase [Candidatus Neomarinimicrobiota bacterium]MBT3896036.1 thymidine phosphorylase [Candidatus Neomarinimicrobiota bacterium]
MKSSVEIIRDKQHNRQHSFEEIKYIVDGFTNGDIPDYQMTAWLMAVYFNGMDISEARHYTKAMIESGKKLDFSYLPDFVVDKHSTGGVGDKVSLILGPLLASCGLYVPMLSGRGLGHTGGTLDKFESIPGYNADLSVSEFSRIVEKVGVSIMGQTADICPADKKIYALRDVTSTVASLHLICGSIMSKKIAEGIRGLVMDIKCGNGAFMNEKSKAEELGVLLKTVGNDYGLKVDYLITDMNQPLGNSVGIWTEVMESIDILKGGGPDDLKYITIKLCEKALIQAGRTGNHISYLENKLNNGDALKIFEQMIDEHGGDLSLLYNPQTYSPNNKQIIVADESGYLQNMDTFKIGISIIEMGGGRLTKADSLDNSAGIVFSKKTGDPVENGEIICEAFCADEARLKKAVQTIKSSITISEEKAPERQLIL